MRRKNDNKITQQDIADALGVSRNTVSKALNGTGYINNATKTRVLQKAKELSYQLLSRERVLSAEREAGKNILLLAHKNTIANQFWTRVVSGIDRVVRRNDSNLMLNIFAGDEEKAESLPDLLARSKPDGIIVHSAFSVDFLQALYRNGIPMVSLDIHPKFAFPNMICDVVTGHNAEAVEIITSRLMDQGHTKIGFVGDIETTLGYQERWKGFARAHTARGIKPDLSRCIIRPRIGYDFFKEEVSAAAAEAPRDTTAYVCVNDPTAIALSRSLTDLGFKLPEDIAVAGYDNTAQYLPLNYGFTTVNSHPEQAGEKLAELLFWRLENKKSCFCVLRVCTEPVFMESTEKCVRR